jgi:hypothetical protein
VGRGHDVAGRLGADVANCVARGKGLGGVRRAGGQFTGGTVAKVRLNVRALGGSGRTLALFQSPLLLGRINQAKVIDAGVLLRGGAGAHEVGNGDGREQTDNRNHDHNFNERKPRLAGSFVFHIYFLIFLIDGVNVTAGGF